MTAATINAFVSTTNAVSNSLQWTQLSGYGIKDITSGDLVFWSYSNASANPVALFTSQDNGKTWARVATDATNPVSDFSHPIGAVQDSTGAVHMLTYTQPIGNPGYGRATLNYTNGHVSGYTWAVQPFALPFHSTGTTETRGQIYDFSLGGTETIVYIFTSGTGSNDLLGYAARATSLTPSSTANFVGLDGTGSDSNVINLTEASGTRNGHTHSAALAQIGSTYDLYMVCGSFDNDQAAAPGGTVSNDDLWVRQLPYSSGNWTVGTASSVGSNIVSAASGVVIPMLLGVYSTSNAAWVMYSSGAAGINFASISTSGTITAVAVTSPLGTTGRCGFGVFTVGSSGDIWTIFNTYGAFGSETPTGKYAHWDGSTWEKNTTDTTAATCVGIISFTGWTSGCAAVRINGDPVAQTVTGVLAGAAIGTLPPNITVQPTNTRTVLGGTASFSVTASSGSGPTYQWQKNTGSGMTNITGATSSTYTTGALAYSDNGTTYQCVLTDSANSLTTTTVVVTAVVDYNTSGTAALRHFAVYADGTFGNGAFGPNLNRKASGGTLHTSTLSAATTVAALMPKTAQAIRSAGTTLLAAIGAVRARVLTLVAATPVLAALVKSVRASRAASTTTAAAIVRSTLKSLAASTTALAAVGLQKAKLVTLAAATPVLGAVGRAVGALRAAATAPAAALARSTSKGLSAATAALGVLAAIKGHFMTLAASTTTLAAMARQVASAKAAATAVLGVRVASVAKAFAASTTALAVVAALKAKLLALSAATVTAANIKRSVLAVRAAATAPLGTVVKSIAHTLSAASVALGVRAVAVSKGVGAATVALAQLAAQKLKLLILTAAVTTLGAVVRRVVALRGAATVAVGATRNIIAKSLAAATVTLAALVSGSARTLVLAASTAVLGTLGKMRALTLTGVVTTLASLAYTVIHGAPVHASIGFVAKAAKRIWIATRSARNWL